MRVFKAVFLRNVSIQLAVGLMFFSASAQRDMTPGKRSDAFGSRDFRNLRNYGLQVSFGPTYQLTRKSNPVMHAESEVGRPIDYVIDPKGRLGVYFDVGTAHFPTTAPRLKFIKKRFVSYYDWGVGFKLFGGTETTDITYYDGTGTQVLSESHGAGKFYNGYISGRGTAHKNIYLNQKYFLDNGLGINLEYRAITGNKEYTNGQKWEDGQADHFHAPFVAQIHYELGLGIRMKRGSYLIPSVQLPVLGMYEMNGGSASLRWFSSNYWPILFKVKWINIFEKKSNGCNTGSEEDRKRNKEYMQGQ